ncbi:hypothetical protein [Streptomyces sp. NPDC058657]|uniref:hypothetical protein n=1 Tax=unclassified Streptomyces TaxID=2593676 RepID=UPI0036598ADB
MTRRNSGTPEFDPGPGPGPGPGTGRGLATWDPRFPLGALQLSPDYDPAAKWVRFGAVALLVPLMLADLMFLGLSPMALDHCAPSEPCYGQLHGLITVATLALLAAAVLLVVSLCLPSRRRRRAARNWLVAGAATAALTSLAALASL